MKMGNDLEINLSDGVIPKLLKSNFETQDYDDELYRYLVTDIEESEDALSLVEKKYGKLVLDVFRYTMDTDDPRLDLLSNDYFRLSQEDKYLKFIENVFYLNEEKVYVDFVYFSDENKILQFIENRMSRLDRIDSYILLNQIDIMRKDQNDMYLIEDLNLLKLFIKCFLREILWCNLYFPKHPMIVSTGYDLGLPVIVKDKQDKENYIKMAEDSRLFLKDTGKIVAPKL